jgi:hypothetical protein
MPSARRRFPISSASLASASVGLRQVAVRLDQLALRLGNLGFPRSHPCLRVLSTHHPPSCTAHPHYHADAGQAGKYQPPGGPGSLQESQVSSRLRPQAAPPARCRPAGSLLQHPICIGLLWRWTEEMSQAAWAMESSETVCLTRIAKHMKLGGGTMSTRCMAEVHGGGTHLPRVTLAGLEGWRGRVFVHPALVRLGVSGAGGPSLLRHSSPPAPLLCASCPTPTAMARTRGREADPGTCCSVMILAQMGEEGVVECRTGSSSSNLSARRERYGGGALPPLLSIYAQQTLGGSGQLHQGECTGLSLTPGTSWRVLSWGY